MAKLCKFFGWNKKEISEEKLHPIDDCGKSRTKSMRVIGLDNLGSTCYFNSALQNLLYLRPFREQLYHTMTRTEYKLVPKKQPDLGTLTFSYSDEKAEPGILTKDIFYLINETISQSEATGESHGRKTRKTFTPKTMHNRIARKYNKFSNGSQQDSHELFRSLIDMVKDEEIQRLKAAFFDHFNIDGHKPHSKNYPKIISKEKLLRYTNEFKNIFVFTGTFIDDTFGGEMIDTVKCLECGTIFDRSEDFFDISLPLPAESEEVNAFNKNDNIPSHNQPQSEVESNSENEGAVNSKELKRLNNPKDYPEGSLEYYLMQYFSPKFLEKDYVCNVCNPQLDSDGDKYDKEDNTESINIDTLTFTDACKQFYIKTLAPVLPIHLNRFSQTEYGLQKLNKRVEFPMVLDMSPFCISDTSVLKDCNNQILYGLRGIVDHAGGIEEGNHVAYVNIADWNKPSKIPSKDNAKSSKISGNDKEKTPTDEPMNTDQECEGNIIHLTSVTSGNDACELPFQSNLSLDPHLYEHVTPTEEWYFISDSHWFRTDRHHVFSSQAYILFYERLPLVAKDTHR